MGKEPESSIYRDILDSVDVLRAKVWRRIIDENLSIIGAAKKIGIAVVTLRNFLIHEKDINLQTITRMTNWVEEPRQTKK